MDFLLVLIELFSLGVTKFQVEGVAPTNHSSSQKTRLSDLSYGIKMWTIIFVLSQITRLADRQTDGRTDRQNAHR